RLLGLLFCAVHVRMPHPSGHSHRVADVRSQLHALAVNLPSASIACEKVIFTGLLAARQTTRQGAQVGALVLFWRCVLWKAKRRGNRQARQREETQCQSAFHEFSPFVIPREGGRLGTPAHIYAFTVECFRPYGKLLICSWNLLQASRKQQNWVNFYFFLL